MRRRLLASTLVVVLVAVVSLGVPLGLVAARLIKDEALASLQRDAQNIGLAVQAQTAVGRTITPAELASITPADRRVVLTKPGATGSRARPATARSSPYSLPVGTGSLLVAAPRDELDAAIVRSWLVIGGLVVLSVVVAVALASAQARRLGRPLEEIAGSAERLGSGDFRTPPRRRYGVFELDRVADVLDSSAVRIAALVRREREFASDASHQLRTPITALQIRLEEVIAASTEPEVQAEAEAALTQAERLTAVVEQLLVRARDERVAAVAPTPVDVVVAEQVRTAQPTFRQAGRSIEVHEAPTLRAMATHAGLGQALAVLLENALRHGAGTVQVATRATQEHVVVEVRDEGPGVPEPLVGRIFDRSVSGTDSTGLGLALARALVEGDGGRLELVQARPPVFAVFLPRVDSGPA